MRSGVENKYDTANQFRKQVREKSSKLGVVCEKREGINDKNKGQY